MEWTVLTAALVGAHAGYLIGVLVRGTFVERGGGGGRERPLEPVLDRPSGDLTDFDLWEFEVTGSANVRA
jgi:hypothetical protein